MDTKTMVADLRLYLPSPARAPKLLQRSTNLTRINESRSSARLTTFTVRLLTQMYTLSFACGCCRLQ